MLKNTEPYLMLMRARLLSDAVAWFEAFKKGKDLRAEIIRLIQEEQLTRSGVDSKGEVIGFYSLLTELISRGRKQFNKPYTLNDTGEFYRSMLVVVLSDSILVRADADKMEDQDWWREDILGLTDENLRIFTDELRVKYVDYARRILFKSR